MKSILRLNVCVARFSGLIALICGIWVLAEAQDQKTPQPSVPVSQSQQIGGEPSPAVPTFKVSTRLVTLEIVARDSHGNPVPGLSAKDFEVFERIPTKKDLKKEVVSALQFVSLAESHVSNQGPAPMPPGVYSNMVGIQKLPIPPTVLLMDGLNTDLSIQVQARRQMVRLLSSISQDVPIAIFLMDRRLHLVQSLTTDPKLLREAAEKIVSNQAPDARKDPRDDPDVTSAAFESVPSGELPPGLLLALQAFERQTYSATMDIQVRETLSSLRAIARYLGGYPGRKNLLWISSSFPLAIGPNGTAGFADMRVYQDQMDEVANALSDAKIAVYPIDPVGLRPALHFDVSNRQRNSGSPNSMGSALSREDNTRFAQEQTMNDLATKTGGRICVNENDLGGCLKTAINDGTSYYELGYYPDSSEWHGEFHEIVVKTKQPGVRLAYRTGYYARPIINSQNSEKENSKQADAALQEAACEDVLISSAIVVAAERGPNARADEVNYTMAIDPKNMTLPLLEGGERSLSMAVAACTFDKRGKPLQYLQSTFRAKLTEPQYEAVARHGIPHKFSVQPKPATTRVRLLVRDAYSGLIGSVDIPYGEAEKTPSPTGNNASN